MFADASFSVIIGILRVVSNTDDDDDDDGSVETNGTGTAGCLRAIFSGSVLMTRFNSDALS